MHVCSWSSSTISVENAAARSFYIDHGLSEENCRQKWGDTEIAERGRSVLVMRARYRSAGLTPHQRRWTDAG